MANFNQAIEWMREGKKVRRESMTNKDFFIHLSIKTDKKYDPGWDRQIWTRAGEAYVCDMNDFGATDWEIYEKESLSDKIKDPELPFSISKEGFIVKEDAKEKIQIVHQRLKTELYLSLEQGFTINKIFKEEFGGKLL